MDKEPSWFMKNYSSKHVKELYDTIDSLQKRLDELETKQTGMLHEIRNYIMPYIKYNTVKFPSSLPDETIPTLPNDGFVTFLHDDDCIRRNSEMKLKSDSSFINNGLCIIKDNTK